MSKHPTQTNLVIPTLTKQNQYSFESAGTLWNLRYKKKKEKEKKRKEKKKRKKKAGVVKQPCSNVGEGFVINLQLSYLTLAIYLR